MKRTNNKKNLYKSIILLVILVIGIGYAYLTSNLSISGQTEVVANTWNIHFENLNVKEGSVTATTPATIDNNNVDITYAITLSRPKEYYEFTVDVKNDGTLPGKVSVSTLSGLDTTSSKVIDYSVTYMNDDELTLGDILNDGSKKTIKVRVFYKDNISASDLPSSNMNLNLTYTLQYVQSEESNITGHIINDGCGTATVFGKNMQKTLFESMETLDYIDVPNDAIDSWDASQEHNGSIIVWYKDQNNNGKYEMYIGQDGGVVPPVNSSCVFSYFYNVTKFDVSHLNTRDVTNMNRFFYYNGYSVNTSYEIIGLDKIDTSNVTNMSEMFEKSVGAHSYSPDYYKIDVSNFDTSNVTNMSNMFYESGAGAKKWEIGDLSNWDTSKVTSMGSMFYNSAMNAIEPCDIGTLDIYSNNIGYIFLENKCLKANINIHNNISIYYQAFEKSATITGSGVTVNYSPSVSNIDDIIATKSSNSNVVKGSSLP